MNEEITQEELEMFDGFFNKGWCCDLNEIYNIGMKILALYKREKEKNM